MTNDKPPMPPQPTTKELPAVRVPQGQLDELVSIVKSGFASVNSRLDTVEANLELQGGSVTDIGKRLTGVEERVHDLETARRDNSMRAKASSAVDLEHDAAIQRLSADVKALAESANAQTAILQRLDKVAANPTVRRVGYALAMALLSYLAAKGWIVR